jgi:hypothetical protein
MSAEKEGKEKWKNIKTIIISVKSKLIYHRTTNQTWKYILIMTIRG